MTPGRAWKQSAAFAFRDRWPVKVPHWQMEFARHMGFPNEPRKRGGQPGNTNAMKHGYFSRAAREERQAGRKHAQVRWAAMLRRTQRGGS